MKSGIGDKTEQLNESTMLAAEHRSEYLELSCELSELERIRECIFQLPVDSGKKKKIFLACEEIFANIINYSGADWIQFHYDSRETEVQVTFSDNGKMFNPLESKNEKEFEDFDAGGMGISLVKELCSDIHYSNMDGKNILSMEFTEK